MGGNKEVEKGRETVSFFMEQNEEIVREGGNEIPFTCSWGSPLVLHNASTIEYCPTLH